ncbi:hypothetical protein AVEN_237895-1, partial [Araneus ventricosus]
GRGGFVVRSQLRSRRAPDSKPDSTEDPRSSVFVGLVHVNPGIGNITSQPSQFEWEEEESVVSQFDSTLSYLSQI